VKNTGTRKQLGMLSKTLPAVPTAPARYPARWWVLREVSQSLPGVVEGKLG